MIMTNTPQISDRKLTNLIKIISSKFSILLIFAIIAGCQHKQSYCFEAFGNSILWNKLATVKFDNNFSQNNSPICLSNNNFSSTSFAVNILDSSIKWNEGNSVVINTTLTSFSKKLSPDEINDSIDHFSNKFLSEANNANKNNKRFTLKHSKLSKFYNDKVKKCKTVTLSAKDYGAANLPPDQEYLLQNDVYKTCFLKNYNQVITLAISYRITQDKENTLWPEDPAYRINLMTKNIILNDGVSVYELIKFNDKEITNLK
jgi:hypothetical protein